MLAEHTMLMNHKNFCFTEIPDKTSDAIFLKSPKPLFKLWLTHGTIYDPLIPCKFRKNTNEPIPR